MSEIHNAPSAERNRDVILQVLRGELTGEQRVLEIGSGTGQHAVHFAAAMPQLSWQTSDLEENHAGIHHWIATSGLLNVAAPVLLDVSDPGDIGSDFDAVFSANTAHIMSAVVASEMLALAGKILKVGGKFLLYGPFRVDGCFTSDSNEAFDKWLKARDPLMGIRDLEWLDEVAAAAGLSRVKACAMPANNMLVVWKKGEARPNNGDA